MDMELKCSNYECKICDFASSKKYQYDRHILTQKHIYMSNNEKKPKKKTENIVCELCDFITFNKKDYNRHILTKKHLKNIESLEIPEEKKISDMSGEVDMKTVILELMKRQDFLQNTLVELAKNQSVTNNTTNNNNNTTNQQFNLQFFLNETCKDAMNIMDFVNSLQLKMEDFEETGKIGFVEGISRIIINGLKSVDTTKRPIHCTDVKRETLYIKNDNSWEKEEPEKTKLKQAVNQVARMNLCQLPKWQQLNPDSAIIDTVDNDKYVKYSIAALGGRSNEEETKMVDKIMRNVMKEVVVDKNERY